MQHHLEILLFDSPAPYHRVHASAKAACKERNIDLRIYDLDTNAELAIQHGVKHFPECILYCDGIRIGMDYRIYHTPETFAAWIDEELKKCLIQGAAGDVSKKLDENNAGRR